MRRQDEERQGPNGNEVQPGGKAFDDVGQARRHQKLSLRAELHYRLALAVLRPAVAYPDVVVLIHEHAVRVIEHSGAEAGHALARGVELLDRREIRAGAIIRCAAAVKNPDALAVSVDIHADGRPPLTSLGQFRPALVNAIGIRCGIRVGSAYSEDSFWEHGDRRNEGEAECVSNATCTKHCLPPTSFSTCGPFPRSPGRPPEPSPLTRCSLLLSL